ncbi:MAG: Ppx/GppA family phosphatase [Rhizobiales bacterium]|nr:Ppx/GppA family phosphatase [Hyphomicrobiales bacterium]NRB12976.1 Ppx/GppA family phosphatase [Hyphomicrobiales bacterium]
MNSQQVETYNTLVDNRLPIAVIDIGSNTVRLVVFEGEYRSPAPIYNETSTCRLGHGLALTGKLNDENVKLTLNLLRRFKILIDNMTISKVHVIATAAAREATNGAGFIVEAEAILGLKINVLTGREEAKYAALGVFSGHRKANGLVGDLGGGSLELVSVTNNKIDENGITLPLGALRLMEISGGNLNTARDIIEAELDKVDFWSSIHGLNFYAVGGTWRALAKMHMHQTGYPLHILQGYRMPWKMAQSFANFVSEMNVGIIKKSEYGISKPRLQILPFGALVLERLLMRAQPNKMVVSACGVREGVLYEKLDKREQKKDPLISASKLYSQNVSRSTKHAEELIEFTAQIFGSELSESSEENRLRQAVCYLDDIGWRAHPNIRGTQSLGVIANAALVAVSHAGRAFIAYTVFYRHEGVRDNNEPQNLKQLIKPKDLVRARVLGLLIRVAYAISGVNHGLLPRIKIHIDAGVLELVLPKELADLKGKHLNGRLKKLAKEMGLAHKIATK